MIRRLDSTSRANFSTIEGVQPYLAKHTKPYYNIQYADTVYTVRSLGLTARWYDEATGWSDSNIIYTGNLPIIKLWYANGYPDVFTDINGVVNWGIKLTGYFQAPATSVKFYLGGQGTVETFELNGVSRITSSLNLREQNSALSETSVCSGLSVGHWYSIEVRFRKNITIGNNAGLVILWQDASSSSNNKVILSAGVTSIEGAAPTNHSMPIDFVDLPNISGPININNSDDIPTFTFSVPLASSSNYRGYKYIKEGDYLQDIEDSNITIKKHRMIQCSLGYYAGSTAESVIKFTGQVRDFHLEEKKEGNDLVDIVCYGYEIFAKDSFNKDSPNTMDYISNEYLEDTGHRYNGLTKPRTFDGWELYRVFQTLLTNAFIDPTLMFQKKVFSDYSGNSVSGGYLIEQLSKSSKIYLDKKSRYGNTNETSGENEDDSYLYKISTGDYFYDVLKELANTYGFKWGCDRTGQVFLKEPAVPNGYINDKNFTFGTGWSNNGLDVDAFKCTYSTTKALNATCSATCSASRISVLLYKGPNSGTATSQNIKAYVYHDTTLISSALTSGYASTSWGYYKGPDDTGVNPVIWTIATNLPYDTYKVKIQNMSASYKIGVEGLFYWDTDYETPVIKLYTGETGSNKGSISDLSLDNTVTDIRNECIVLGSREGTKVGKKSDGTIDVVNPNNPIYLFVNSSTRDINSIYCSTSLNYVGRPLSVLIYEPTVVSQNQVDFISFNTVEKYRTAKSIPNITIIGNPLLEVGDCVVVVDIFKETLKSTNYLWIETIENSVGDVYTCSLTLTPYSPIEGYFPKINPEFSDINYNVIGNLSISNRGVFTSILDGHAVSSSDSTIYVGSTEGAPDIGYLKIIKTEPFLYSGTYDNSVYHHVYLGCYEIVKYTGKTAGSFTGCIRGLQGTRPTSHPIWTDVVAAWDPYTQDSMGINPIIKFDLYRTGKVCLTMWAKDEQFQGMFWRYGNEYQVDTLTGLTDDSWPTVGYDRLQIGKDYMYPFGGYDNIGYWNSSHDETLNGTTGFVSEPMFREHHYNGSDSWLSRIFYHFSTLRPHLTFIDEETGRAFTYDYSTGESYKLLMRRGNVGKVTGSYYDSKIMYTNRLSHKHYYNETYFVFPTYAPSTQSVATTSQDAEIFYDSTSYGLSKTRRILPSGFNYPTALSYHLVCLGCSTVCVVNEDVTGPEFTYMGYGRTTYDYSVDPDFVRFFSADLKINRNTLYGCLGKAHDSGSNLWAVNVTKANYDLLKYTESTLDLTNNGSGRVFKWDPLQAGLTFFNNAEISNADLDWRNNMNTLHGHDDAGTVGSILFKHVFYVSGNFRDNSGRNAIATGSLIINYLWPQEQNGGYFGLYRAIWVDNKRIIRWAQMDDTSHYILGTGFLNTFDHNGHIFNYEMGDTTHWFTCVNSAILT